MLKKVITLLIVFCLIFEQAGFSQVGPQISLPAFMNPTVPVQDIFRPVHLRSLTYTSAEKNFSFFLDQGDTRDLKPLQIEETAAKLMEYFQIGLALPDSMFWVNLRPDSPDEVIDNYLAQTDLGKIMLEADVQLKKDTAKYTSPDTPEGKDYWDKLYGKAEELFGSENISVPTVTRPWIIPGEVIISESAGNAYIFKATLKVMLEADHLKSASAADFPDERLKILNDYSSQLIRQRVLPKLTKEVNSSKRYAALRQVYYSLILAQWFKNQVTKSQGEYDLLSSRIDSKDLQGLASKTQWSKEAYFKQYQKSFKDGEYNLQKNVQTPFGPAIRQYFSGGIIFDSKDASNLADGGKKVISGGALSDTVKFIAEKLNFLKVNFRISDDNRAIIIPALDKPKLPKRNPTPVSEKEGISLADYIRYIKVSLAEKGKDAENFDDLKALQDRVNASNYGPANILPLITRQADTIEQSILELISNCSDAITGRAQSIGRFGMGGLQMLAFVNEGGRIGVQTATSGDKARQIEFFRGKDKNIYFTAEKTTKETNGTVVDIEVPSHMVGVEAAVIEYLRSRLNLFTRMPVYLNGELLNPLDSYVYLNGDTLKYDFPDKRIDVTIQEGRIIVEDKGSGMSDDVIFKKYLVPRLGENNPIPKQQSNEEISGQVHLFYRAPVFSGKEALCRIVFQVAGINIQSFMVNGYDLPQELVIQLPSSTRLPVSRNEIEIDESTHAAISALAAKISAKNPIHQVSLINGFMQAVKLLDEKNKRVGALQPLLDSAKGQLIPFAMRQNKLILPNDSLFHQIEYPQGTLFLDEELIYSISPEQIPGAEDISAGFAKAKFKKAFTVPFQASSRLSYLTFGPYILVNRTIYEKWKEYPLLLNLRLNFFVGYGKRNPDKGWFLPYEKRLEQEKKLQIQLLPLLEKKAFLNAVLSEEQKQWLHDRLKNNPRDEKSLDELFIRLNDFAGGIPASLREIIDWGKILPFKDIDQEAFSALLKFPAGILMPDNNFLALHGAYFGNREFPERLNRYSSNLLIAGSLRRFNGNGILHSLISQIEAKAVALLDEEIFEYAQEVFKDKNLEGYEDCFQAINEGLGYVDGNSAKRLILRWMRIYKNNPKAAGKFYEMLKREFVREQEAAPPEAVAPENLSVNGKYDFSSVESVKTIKLDSESRAPTVSALVTDGRFQGSLAVADAKTGAIIIIDASSGQVKQEFPTGLSSFSIQSLAYIENNQLAVSDGEDVVIIDFSSALINSEKMLIKKLGIKAPTSLAYLGEGKLALGSLAPRGLAIFDLKTKEMIWRTDLPHIVGGVVSLGNNRLASVNPKNGLILVTEFEESISGLVSEYLTPVQTREHVLNTIPVLAFLGDNKLVFQENEGGGPITILDMKNDEVVWSSKDHEDLRGIKALGMSYLGDGRLVLSAPMDGTLKVVKFKAVEEGAGKYDFSKIAAKTSHSATKSEEDKAFVSYSRIDRLIKAAVNSPLDFVHALLDDLSMIERLFKEFKDPICAVRIDGSKLVVGYKGDNSVRIFDLKKKELILAINLGEHQMPEALEYDDGELRITSQDTVTGAFGKQQQVTVVKFQKTAASKDSRSGESGQFVDPEKLPYQAAQAYKADYFDIPRKSRSLGTYKDGNPLFAAMDENNKNIINIFTVDRDSRKNRQLTDFGLAFFPSNGVIATGMNFQGDKPVFVAQSDDGRVAFMAFDMENNKASLISVIFDQQGNALGSSKRVEFTGMNKDGKPVFTATSGNHIYFNTVDFVHGKAEFMAGTVVPLSNRGTGPVIPIGLDRGGKHMFLAAGDRGEPAVFTVDGSRVEEISYSWPKGFDLRDVSFIGSDKNGSAIIAFTGSTEILVAGIDFENRVFKILREYDFPAGLGALEAEGIRFDRNSGKLTAMFYAPGDDINRAVELDLSAALVKPTQERSSPTFPNQILDPERIPLAEAIKVVYKESYDPGQSIISLDTEVDGMQLYIRSEKDRQTLSVFAIDRRTGDKAELPHFDANMYLAPIDGLYLSGFKYGGVDPVFTAYSTEGIKFYTYSIEKRSIRELARFDRDEPIFDKSHNRVIFSGLYEKGLPVFISYGSKIAAFTLDFVSRNATLLEDMPIESPIERLRPTGLKSRGKDVFIGNNFAGLQAVTIDPVTWRMESSLISPLKSDSPESRTDYARTSLVTSMSFNGKPVIIFRDEVILNHLIFASWDIESNTYEKIKSLDMNNCKGDAANLLAFLDNTAYDPQKKEFAAIARLSRNARKSGDDNDYFGIVSLDLSAAVADFTPAQPEPASPFLILEPQNMPSDEEMKIEHRDSTDKRVSYLGKDKQGRRLFAVHEEDSLGKIKVFSVDKNGEKEERAQHRLGFLSSIESPLFTGWHLGADPVLLLRDLKEMKFFKFNQQDNKIEQIAGFDSEKNGLNYHPEVEFTGLYDDNKPVFIAYGYAATVFTLDYANNLALPLNSIKASLAILSLRRAPFEIKGKVAFLFVDNSQIKILTLDKETKAMEVIPISSRDGKSALGFEPIDSLSSSSIRLEPILMDNGPSSFPNVRRDTLPSGVIGTELYYQGKPVIVFYDSMRKGKLIYASLDLEKNEYQVIRQYELNDIKEEHGSLYLYDINFDPILKELSAVARDSGRFDGFISWDLSKAIKTPRQKENPLPMIRSGFAALDSRDDLSGLPALERNLVRFLKEKDIEFIEEAEVEPRDPSWKEIVNIAKEPIPLAALNYVFDKNAEEIKADPGLTPEKFLAMLGAAKNINLASYLQIVLSAIESQDRTERVWVREVGIQNPRDAIRKAREKGELAIDEGAIIHRNFLSKKEWVYSIRDPVGMDFWKLVRYYFPLDESSKNYLEDTGNLGQGNYTLFADFDEVFIRTSEGNGMINELVIANDPQKGPMIVSWEVLEGKYKGTEIRRKKDLAGSDPQLESLFIQEALQRFGGAIQSPQSSKEQGIEPDARDVEIRYNGKTFREEIKVAASSKIGKGWGAVTIARAKEKLNKRVIQDGIFIKFPDPKELKYVPQRIIDAYQRFGGLHIMIPREIMLNIPRNGYSQEGKFLHRLQVAILHAMMQAVLKDYSERIAPIPGEPQDYYSNEGAYDDFRAKKIAGLMEEGEYDGITSGMLEPFVSDPLKFFELLSHVPFSSSNHNGKITLHLIREKLLEAAKLRKARAEAADIGSRSFSDIFSGKIPSGSFGEQVEEAAGLESLFGQALAGLLGQEMAQRGKAAPGKKQVPEEALVYVEPLFIRLLQTIGIKNPKVVYGYFPTAAIAFVKNNTYFFWNLEHSEARMRALAGLAQAGKIKEALKTDENNLWRFLEDSVHESQHHALFEQPGDHTHHSDETIDNSFAFRMGAALDRILFGMSAQEIIDPENAAGESVATSGAQDSTRESLLDGGQNSDRGGIDLRQIPAQFRGALGALNDEAAGFDLAEVDCQSELSSVQTLAERGMLPSVQRIAGILQAARLQGQVVRVRPGLLFCLAAILRSEEKECEPAQPEVKSILWFLASL
jgi:WD40 repeat protein